MAEPFDTLAQQLKDALDAGDIAGVAGVLADLEPDVLTQLRQSLALQGRWDGLLLLSAPPTNVMGAPGAIAVVIHPVTKAKTFFGPKDEVTGWPDGEPFLKGDQGNTGPAGPKGDKGDTGDTGATGAKGDTGSQGPQGDVGPKGDQGDTGPKGDTGDQGPQGDPGIDGDDGWTQVEAISVDGDRRVKQIVDWIGGTGTKPATGKYVGAAGLVDTAAEATDVRGPGGSGSGDMQGANNLSDLTDDAAARTNLVVYSKGEVDAVLSGKATPADITAAINALVDGAPTALDTLKELADALADDDDAIAALTLALDGKASQAALDALGVTVAAIVVPVKATGAELRTATNDAKFLTPKSVADALAPPAGTVATPDLSIPVQTITLTANSTLGAPTGGKNGTSGRIYVKKAANYTLGYNTAWKPYGNLPSVTVGSNTVDTIVWDIDDAGVLGFGMLKGRAS